MRIVHWTEGFWPFIGGIETFLHHLVAVQRRAGDDVLVLTNRVLDSLPEQQDYDGVEVQRKPFTRATATNDVLALGRIVRETAALLRAFRADVNHVHLNGRVPWLHLLTREAAPAPCVVTLHTPAANMSLPPAVLQRILQSADGVAAVSDATRREWTGSFDCLREKAVVVWNGVPWPSLEPGAPTFDPITLLCLGRLDPLKGFHVALRAFANLAERWPAARLVIAGDGPDRENLQQLTSELGLQARVDFSGWVAPEQVPAAMSAATIVLMPSRWEEPFGLVAVEAAQMGRPVIASAVGGLPEIVVDHQTGLLVPRDDPAALAAAIESLLRCPEKLRQFGAAARERARAEFTMERCAADYRQLYRSLIRPPLEAAAGA